MTYNQVMLLVALAFFATAIREIWRGTAYSSPLLVAVQMGGAILAGAAGANAAPVSEEARIPSAVVAIVVLVVVAIWDDAYDFILARFEKNRHVD